MTDVDLIWFWLRERGVSPISSLRDFVRRARWAAYADGMAAADLSRVARDIGPRWTRPEESMVATSTWADAARILERVPAAEP